MKTKKQMVWLLCGLVALTTGCRQNELDIPGGKVLKAVIEGGETRTSFDSYEGKFAWTADDKLAVFYSDGTKSEATVATDGTVNVPASTESRYRSYYAVYPASVADPDNYGNPTLKVTLPTSYDITGKSEDYSPLPMVAVNDEDDDLLMFYHVGGLLRITLQGVKTGTKRVRVTFDKDVAGTYTVSSPGTDHPTITTAGATTDNVVEFTGISSTDRIVLNVPVPCGTYSSVKVETLNSSSTVTASQTFDDRDLVFLRHHGKKLAFKDLAFDFKFAYINNQQVPYTGGTAAIQNSFYSYKQKGSTSEPVPFTLEYSEDEGVTWTTTPPSWVTPGTIDPNGSISSVPLVYTVAPNQVSMEEDVHHVELRKDSRAQQNFDLSTYNVATGEIVHRTTANCYVVRGAGTYKFPLVYGNGIDWTKNPATGVNEDAYRGKDGEAGVYRPDDGEQGSSNYLGRFKDHLDQNINSPFIATQMAGKTLKATLIWEDVQGLVTDVDISGSGENAYITFRVPKETITQGNALVAVLADGVIAWSWHIWVTEEDLTAAKEGSNGYWFAPVNLGWCEAKTENYYARTCMIRVTQSISGLVREASLTQTQKTVKIGGNNPYYQWGRKDPLQASIRSNVIKTYYPFTEDYAPATKASQVSIGEAIQHPYWFYRIHPSGVDKQNWCNTFYRNLWNSAQYPIPNNGAMPYVTKTVYDPSPVGYKVPTTKAWSDFSNGSEWKDKGDGTLGREWKGLFFPAMGALDYSAHDNDYYGSRSAYYSSSPADYSQPGFSLFFYSTSVSTGPVSVGHAAAQSVRSVKD